MGLMTEYMNRRLGPNEVLDELQRLIKIYNKYKNTYMLFYASAPEKPIPDCALCMDDHFTIRDFLKNIESKKLDFEVVSKFKTSSRS